MGCLSLHEGLRLYPTGPKYSTTRNEFHCSFQKLINNDISTAKLFLQLKAMRLCLLAVNLKWIQKKELMT